MRKLLAIALVGLLGSFMPARAEAVRYLDPDVFPVVDVTEDILYSAEHDLALDLTEPAGDEETSRAAIVLAHGGGFTSGEREDMASIAEDFARRGFVAVSISYRLDPDLAYEDLIVGSLAGELPRAMHDAQHDMQAAVRWLRANAATYRVDSEAIVAGGVSAGASMSLEAAYNPEDDDAVEGDFPSDVAAAFSISGATDPRRIEPGAPPVVMFNGLQDSTAPYPTAILSCGTASLLLNICSLTTYPQDGHDLSDHTDEMIQLGATFLCDNVLSC